MSPEFLILVESCLLRKMRKMSVVEEHTLKLYREITEEQKKISAARKMLTDTNQRSEYLGYWSAQNVVRTYLNKALRGILLDFTSLEDALQSEIDWLTSNISMQQHVPDIFISARCKEYKTIKNRLEAILEKEEEELKSERLVS